MQGEDPAAEAALHLLISIGRAGDMVGLAAARSWRVRRVVARQAGSRPHLSLCDSLLRDRRVAVRLAVVQAAAFLQDEPRAQVMRLALQDRSWRVLRVAAAYLRDDPDVRARFEDEGQGPDPARRVRALRVLTLVGASSAKPLLDRALVSSNARIRATGYRGLVEAGLLDRGHLALLQSETDPGVLVPALRSALRKGGDLARASRPLLRGDAFVGQPGAAGVIMRLPPWDAAPLALRAIAEGWPGAIDALPGFLQRWRKRRAQGWIEPSQSQLRAIDEALSKYAHRVTPEGHELAHVMRELLRLHAAPP